MKKTHILGVLVLLAVTVVACTPKEQKEVADTMMEDSHGGDVMEKSAKDMMDNKGEFGETMEKDTSVVDAMEKKVPEEKKVDVMEMEFDFYGDLVDVSGGNAAGTAQAVFKDGVYNMVAFFTDLPDPQGTDFYEGWVVRKNPLSVISTGKAIKDISAGVNEGVYNNIYSSGDDLTDHTFYVLTIEPDDGDPAPAGHILEGTMTK